MANIIRVGGNGGAAAKEVTPSYTGNSQIFGDGKKGYIELYDSGVLTFNTDVTVDMFLVGGGASGGSCMNTTYASGGGGGGYTKTLRNIPFAKNTPIEVSIGAGGVLSDGGTTSVSTYSAEGGKRPSNNTGTNDFVKGGNGGSGGGAGANSSFAVGAAGGSNGADGSAVSAYAGGTGQGVSTYEFLDSQLRLFSGGGGGGGRYQDGDYTNGGAGGAGGGGAGGKGNTVGTPGTASTGGGGGGTGGGNGYGSGVGKQDAASGGSGIAIIRWGDWTTA